MRFAAYAGELKVTTFTPRTWAVLAGASLLYGASNALLALAWREILLRFDTVIDRRSALRTYGISQIAKYVPGNVFQFASRQVIGLSRSLAGGALARSVYWELGVLSSSGVLVGLLALPLLLQDLPVWGGGALFVAAAAGAGVAVSRRLGRPVAAAVAYHVAFLALAGGVFLVVLTDLGSPSVTQAGLALAAVGSYVVAWLAGLLTPGAPAGVGVREVVLLFLLGDQQPEQALLVAVLAHRAATLVGDVLFFGAALLLRPHHETSRKA
jgi:hypothetical protein